MGVRTRSTTSSPVKKTAPAPTSPSKQPPPENGQLHLLIVPNSLSTEARILLLPSPRDSTRQRFLFCPSKGLFELTRVAAPSTNFRSLLFAPTEVALPARVNRREKEADTSRGYLQKDAVFLVATPFDLMFLLLPLLPSPIGIATKTLFQPLDDLFESKTADDPHLRYIIQNGKSLVAKTMTRFCDTIDAGDENVFRVSEEKVLNILHTKADTMVSRGLPASMEQRFVTRALEVPVLSIKREETTVSTITRENTVDEDPNTKSESSDSASTAVSSKAPSVFSEASVASSATTIAPEPVSPEITRLMRLKVALDFMFASYFPATIAEHLRPKIMQDKSLADFRPVEEHLKHLASLKAEALVSRSFGDFSRKRGNSDDDEATEDRTEKKRKLEEDEKRKKANLSRGVRELSKVNVTGMKKMSDFFGKKPSAAKAKS